MLLLLFFAAATANAIFAAAAAAISGIDNVFAADPVATFATTNDTHHSGVNS